MVLSASPPCAPTTRVWPSGADFATTSTPMLPPPPGRFSITIGWPRRSASRGPMSLATVSELPPGVNVTITRMGLFG
jgi:hypothetical protein